MPFFIKFSFKIFPVHRMFSIIKVRKTHRRICRRLFFKKGEGCSLKRESGAAAFLWVLRNFKERLFSSTYANCCYWNLGISLLRSILCKVHIEEMSILVFIHFKLILESSTTSGLHLEPYQTSMMKLLAVVFSQKPSIKDIAHGSKYDSAASFLKYFSTFFVGY